MREGGLAACLRLRDDHFGDRDIHWQDVGRTADDRAGEQLHAVGARRELRARPLPCLLGRCRFGTRPAVIGIELSDVDRRPVSRIKRRVRREQQRAAQFPALDPLTQCDRVARYAGHLERSGEAPARQHPLQRGFQRRRRLRCCIEDVRPEQVDVAVPEAGDDRCAAAVDHRHAVGNGHVAHVSDVLDASVVHDDRRIGEARRIGRPVDRRTDDREILCAADRRNEQERSGESRAENGEPLPKQFGQPHCDLTFELSRA